MTTEPVLDTKTRKQFLFFAMTEIKFSYTLNTLKCSHKDVRTLRLYYTTKS